MKSVFYAILAFAAGAGAHQLQRLATPPAASVAAPAAPVLTVSQFLAQPDKRKAAWARCADDPGTTRDDPECINVRTAERIATGGSGRVVFTP